MQIYVSLYFQFFVQEAKNLEQTTQHLSLLDAGMVAGMCHHAHLQVWIMETT